MALLQNLVPDPTTRNLWQCRPAALPMAVFDDSFPGATFVSCYRVIGTRIYGMVASILNPGHDQPFVYDIANGTFIAIVGVTAANTPISPQTGGVWNPPTLDLIGSKIIVAHPGFNGTAGAFFGVLDIGNPAIPVWNAQNTAPTALIFPPQWVVNFNGRCFFFVNPPNVQPTAYMSDQLNPTVITNATQILTFGDNVPLTCAVGLPLNNQLGGKVQSLMVFKGVSNIYQVTGDFSLGNLDINTLNVATGTYAPNTVVSTSKGLMFAAPDGMRNIDFNATVSDPVGNDGDGITVPFINALTPSRMAASYNSGVYRVQLQNGAATGNPQQQWWYDVVRNIWSGPHTQAASLMAPYAGSFIVTLQNVDGKLWLSDPVQSSTSTFVENGTALQWQWATPMLPDTDQMAEIAMIESTLHLALVSPNIVTVQAQDQNATVLDTVTVVPTGSTTLWGAFTWGHALWQGTADALFPRRLSWHFPLVFRRMAIIASGASVPQFKIGRLHLRYQVLGYLQEDGD